MSAPLEALALAQFGEPSQRTPHEWRWGSNGSLALALTGEKRGLWFNHESGEGGRLTEATEAPRPTPKAETRPKQATDYPRKIATRMRGLHGTLAERYLVEVRGIPRPPGGWPHALGFDPVDRALTGIVRDDTGAVVAVHRVFLTPDGQKLDPAELPARRLRAVKQTNGPKGLGSLILGDSGTGWLCVVEGLETGSAVHIATGLDVLVTLGTLTQAKRLPADRPLVFCVEDDAQGSPAARAAQARIASLIEAGREVRTAWPWPERRHDKSDLADVIMTGGVEAVRARIEAATAPEAKPATGSHRSTTGFHDQAETVPAAFAQPTLKPCPPPRPLPTATLDDARAYYAETVSMRGTGQKTRVLMGGMGGTGKTEAGVRHAHGTLPPGERMITLVPEHDVLGGQLVKRYSEAGVRSVAMRGRGDPYHPKPGIDLCTQLEDVKQALKANQDVSSAVCGREGGPCCVDRAPCLFWKGREEAVKTPNVVGSHNWLMEELPESILKGSYGPWDQSRPITRIVIEEEFVDQATWIFNLDLETFGEAALRQWPVLRKNEPNAKTTAWLDECFTDLRDAIPDTGDVTAEMLLAHVSRKRLAAAMRVCKRRMVTSKMYPGMPADERRERAAVEAINGLTGRIVTTLGLMIDVVDGKAPGAITANTDTGRDGTRRSITVHTVRKLADWVEGKDVLVVNNSPRIEEARRLLPGLVERTPPAVVTPHVDTRLIIGGFAKGTVEKSATKRRDMNTFLKLEALGQEANSFVGFKGTKEAVAKDVPGNIVRHHLQNAGDDSLKNVSVHTMQDGIRLSTRDLAKLVRAKTGRRPSEAPPVWGVGRILMADGSGREVPVLRYADPDMQAEYEAHFYPSATQGGGARARAAMRTEATPLRNNILGRFAPLEVINSVHHWEDVKPGYLGEMVVRGAVDLNAATMTAMHKPLFKNEKAASDKRERFGDPMERVRGWVERDTRAWVVLRWRLAGPGHKEQITICPADEADRVIAARERALGYIAEWRAEPFTPGREPRRTAGNEATVEDIRLSVKDYLTVSRMSSDAWDAVPPAWVIEDLGTGAELVWDADDG